MVKYINISFHKSKVNTVKPWLTDIICSKIAFVSRNRAVTRPWLRFQALVASWAEGPLATFWHFSILHNLWIIITFILHLRILKRCIQKFYDRETWHLTCVYLQLKWRKIYQMWICITKKCQSLFWLCRLVTTVSGAVNRNVICTNRKKFILYCLRPAILKEFHKTVKGALKNGK